MRSQALVAAMSIFTLIGCAPSADEGPVPICVDGTCDENGETTEEEWYFEPCEQQALAMSEQELAAVLALPAYQEDQEGDPAYVALGQTICLDGFLFDDDEGVYECAAIHLPASPNGVFVMPRLVEGCSDGICRTDEAGSPVCEECEPGEQACAAFDGGAWGVFHCSADYEWVQQEQCGEPAPDQGTCGFEDDGSPFCTNPI